MRKLLLLLALLPALAFGQQYPAGSGGGFDGGEVDNPFLAPDGTEALPAYSFTANPELGMRNNAGDLYFSVDGSDALRILSNGAQVVDANTGNLIATFGPSGGTLRSGASVAASWTATDFNGNFGFKSLTAGTQSDRAYQGSNEITTGIHFPAALQATFGTFVASGSYTGEFRASSSGSVGLATVYAADGGNNARINVFTTFVEIPDSGTDLRIVGGSAGAPSYTFIDNLGDGLYHDSTTAAPSISDDGLSIAIFEEVTATEGYLQLDEDVALKFEGATDDAFETILTVTDPTAVNTVTFPDSSGTVMMNVSGQVIGPNGNAGAPAFAFVNDPDTGIFRNAGGNILGLSAAGGEKLQIQSGRMVGLVAYTTPDGSAGVPGYGFSNDTNTGIYSRVDESVNISGSGKGILETDYVSGTETHVILMDDADLQFEGATDDAFETTISAVDPTQDNAVTLQDTLGIIPVLQTGVSDLTDSVATGMVRFDIATSEFVTGQVNVKVYCTDGADELIGLCQSNFACYNDAGTESCGFIDDTCAAGTGVGSAGTLSQINWGSAVGTDTVDFTLDVICSLTSTVLEGVWEVTFKAGDGRLITELN